LRSLGTIFENIFFMLKLLRKVCRTVCLSTLTQELLECSGDNFVKKISPTFYVSVSFLYDGTTRALIVPDLFSSLFKPFKPLKNLIMR
jgi:hypothetical protein